MHNVKVHIIFDFCVFISAAYTTVGMPKTDNLLSGYPFIG